MLPLSEDGYRLAVAVLIVNGIQRAARMHRAEDDVIGQFGDILVAAESAGAAQPVTQAEENPCKSPKKNAAQSIYAPICSKKHKKNILCSMPLLSEIMTKFAHNSFQAQTKTTKHLFLFHHNLIKNFIVAQRLGRLSAYTEDLFYNMQQLRIASLFSGCGGLDLGCIGGFSFYG